MALTEIVNESCRNVIESLKKCDFDFILFDYLKSKFKVLVFSELAEKLENKNYTYTEVYDCFLDSFYETYFPELEEIYKYGIWILFY